MEVTFYELVDQICLAYRHTRALGVHNLTDDEIREVATKQAQQLMKEGKKWTGYGSFGGG